MVDLIFNASCGQSMANPKHFTKWFIWELNVQGLCRLDLVKCCCCCYHKSHIKYIVHKLNAVIFVIIISIVVQQQIMLLITLGLVSRQLFDSDLIPMMDTSPFPSSFTL